MKITCQCPSVRCGRRADIDSRCTEFTCPCGTKFNPHHYPPQTPLYSAEAEKIVQETWGPQRGSWPYPTAADLEMPDVTDPRHDYHTALGVSDNFIKSDAEVAALRAERQQVSISLPDLKFRKPETPIERALATQSPSHVTAERPLTREVLGFLNDLCHPEHYGYAVTAEVRQRARELAGKLESEERIP